MKTKQALRHYFCSIRTQFSYEMQATIAQQFSMYFLQESLVQKAEHIACYMPQKGELDIKPFMERLWAMKKNCYLPVLEPDKTLGFVQYTKDSVLKNNQYNIPEPVKESGKSIAPSALELVLLPLVAYDLNGNRLGMGAGYYDRTFSFKLKEKSHSPMLVGVAHACQFHDRLPVDEWDVPLDAIATESKLTVLHTE